MQTGLKDMQSKAFSLNFIIYRILSSENNSPGKNVFIAEELA